MRRPRIVLLAFFGIVAVGLLAPGLVGAQDGVAFSTPPKQDPPPLGPGPNCLPGTEHRSIPAGWSLVAGYTAASAQPRPLAAYRWTGTKYEALDPAVSDGTDGIWILMSEEGMGGLVRDCPLNSAFPLVANQWRLVGNPGMQSYRAAGFDEFWVYDAGSGEYQATDLLLPGQGAWAISYTGSALRFSPN